MGSPVDQLPAPSTALGGVVATYVVSAGQTIGAAAIAGGTPVLARGAIVDRSITFAPGSNGTPFDADASSLPDAVAGL